VIERRVSVSSDIVASSSVVNALAGTSTIDYDIACVVFLLLCCGCLCFLSSSRSLCPPLSIELYIGTIIHTVTTVSTFNTKVRLPNCIVQRVFFSRSRGPYNFFAKNST
jgi:hypothetical protein